MSDNVDPERLKWLLVRDLLFGLNHKMRNTEDAYKLAKTCTWPEAKWLVDICEKNGGMPETTTSIKAMFLREKDDTRALSFAANVDHDMSIAHRAAVMGDAFAQAIMNNITNERYWAELSAAQDEPLGLIRLGHYALGHYDVSNTIAKYDKLVAMRCFKRAIELGNITSYFHLAQMHCPDTDPEYYALLGKYGKGASCSYDFCRSMHNQMDKYRRDIGRPAIIFQIGKSLVGNVDKTQMILFGVTRSYDQEVWITDACDAVDFFNNCCLRTRAAVDTWTIIATRLKVVKDIRRVIGQLIWETRSLYK